MLYYILIYIMMIIIIIIFTLTKRHFLYYFLERVEGREEGRARNIDMREKHQSIAFDMLPDRGGLQPGHVR